MLARAITSLGYFIPTVDEYPMVALKIKSFDTLPSSYLMFIKLSISIYSLSDSFFTSITKLSPPSLVIISPSERFRYMIFV